MDEVPLMREHPVVARNMRPRLPADSVAWSVLGLLVLLCVFSYLLEVESRGPLPGLLEFGAWEALAPLLALEFGLVGALIVRRHPKHAVGWLAITGGLCSSLSVFAGAYAAYSLTHDQALPATWLAIWLRAWLWYPGLAMLFTLLPAVFPNGRLPSRRWRSIAWAVTAGSAVQLVMVSLTQAMFGFPQPDGPYAKLGWLLNPLTPLAGLLMLGTLFAAVAALVVRFRRSDGQVRQQLKWLVAAIALEAAAVAATEATNWISQLATYQQYVGALIPVVVLLMPAAIGIAILRHQLYDIDLVISQGLTYTGVAAFITGAYVLVVVGVGVALGTGGRPNLPLSVVAMAVVALVIQPLRLRLERLANRLVYGAPSDPYSVLAEISRTPAGGDIGLALGRIAQAVARGLGGRPVRVHLRLPGGHERTATWPPGATGEFGQTFAVSHRGESVGEIEAEGSGNQGLAEALTTQAGLALRTLRLAAELDTKLAQLEAQADELAASRTRLVQAEEAERRRLERDLHDGIQQDLVVLITKARLARNQFERDPAAAAGTMADLQSSAQHALADLRALARGIHPAVLSSRGLVEAVEAIAARMSVGVRVEADPTLRELRYAPEIEGAAYFVVAESLANVLKHSGATEATVTISARDSHLLVAITDAGRGYDQGAVRESGLRGLRDRVEALGGCLAIDSGGRGTCVEASLPARQASHA